MHHLVDLGQILQIHCLKWCMNQSSCEEINCLFAVLSVSDVAALDANHLEYRLKHRCLNLGACRQADDNNCATRSDVLGSLLEWLLVDSDKDNSVWAEAI